MTKPPDLTLRARKILSAVVTEYLQSGEAVGSRTVTRRHGIGLSPASVRNVMSDLEEMGLLEQPHTSAGRVPTETGLRFFIDSLLRLRGLSPKEKDDIRTRVGGTADLDALLQRTSRVLSEITHHAGIVLAPLPSRQRFRHIEFVPLKGGRFLCILVTTDGTIENKIVQAEFDIGRERLERIHNYLDALLSGLTIEEVRARILRELGEEKNQYDDLVSAALRISKAAFEHSGRAEIVVSGGANLLGSARPVDEQGMERMQTLLRALEDKEVMVKLLDRTVVSEGIQVFLGAETDYAPLGESSLVATPYGPDEKPLGAIAVIGPMRMNYGKVMSVVDFTAALVSRMMQDL